MARATWVISETGDTPAQLRQRVWEQMVCRYEGVILVDSDDVLHPTRVAAARCALRSSDVSGCSLRLVDECGRDLHLTMTLPEETAPQDILPRYNLYGLSNSAYRTTVLELCLPIPAEVVHVDWFLVTRAWLHGASLAFDPVPRMDYRQHEANMAHSWGRVSPERVRVDTVSAQTHFALLKDAPSHAVLPERVALMDQVAADIDAFYQHVVTEPKKLDRYVQALNALPRLPIWWSHVAHPSLRHLWARTEEL